MSRARNRSRPILRRVAAQDVSPTSSTTLSDLRETRRALPRAGHSCQPPPVRGTEPDRTGLPSRVRRARLWRWVKAAARRKGAPRKQCKNVLHFRVAASGLWTSPPLCDSPKAAKVGAGAGGFRQTPPPPSARESNVEMLLRSLGTSARPLVASVARAANLGRPFLSAAGAGITALWYAAVVLPEAQTVLHRQRERKDGVTWSQPRRFVPFLAAVGYLASLPAAVALRVLPHCAAASRVASAATFVNPPTLLILSVILSEVVTGVAARFERVARALFAAIRGKFSRA
jgi:hypothetical protein